MGALPPPIDMLRAEGNRTPADPPSEALRVSDNAIVAKRWAWRLGLVVTPAMAGTVALAITLAVVPAPRMSPDLVGLLRSMVLIKGLIGLGAGALVYWRFGRPLRSGLAWTYIASLSLSAAALGWLWGLHWVPIGGAFYWVGLIGLLLVARRDPLLANGSDRSG